MLFNSPPGDWDGGERGLACLPAREAVQPTYVDKLRWAAGETARSGRDLLIEPINPRDIPRFFLNRQDHAHEIVERVGAPKVQMNLYHCQIVEGDLATKIRNYLPTGRITPGCPADLVLLAATDEYELLDPRGRKRTVIRAGQILERSEK